MNLRSNGLRPVQDGRVLGCRASDGVPSAVDITWLVDTGADLATIRDKFGRLFQYQKSIGATASPTTGGGGIQVVSGLEAEFTVRDQWGNETAVVSNQLMGVKSNDAGSDLLGMEQLADLGVCVEWEPRSGSGQLRF